MIQPLWRTVWRFLKKKKLGLKLPYDPATPLLGMCPKETRTGKDTLTPSSLQHYRLCYNIIARISAINSAINTIAGIWKQPRCPSADEWIRKL